MTSAITLSDGRRLEYLLSGPENAPVLVFHHGTPGSLVQPSTLREVVAARGLRLLTFSRPGYGGSDRQGGRSVADVTADTAELADALGLDAFFVGGWSGGGPHALACGAHLPERVRGRILVIAGLAPYEAAGLDFFAGMAPGDVEEYQVTARGEEQARPWMQARAAGEDGGLVPADLPDADLEVVSGPFGGELFDHLQQGLVHGVDGWLDDTTAFIRPWGFALEQVQTPVDVWHGGLDHTVPVAHGVWVTDNLPNATAHLQEGDGHVSIALSHLDKMLDAMLTS